MLPLFVNCIYDRFNLIFITKRKKRSSFLNLLNVETLSYAENIDYSVPDMSNDPKQCTIEIWIGAGVEGNTGSGYYKKEKGIVNTCRTGDSGCDPYNCHQRVK